MRIGVSHFPILAGGLALAMAAGCNRPGADPSPRPAPAAAASPQAGKPATAVKDEIPAAGRTAPAAEGETAPEPENATLEEPKMSSSHKPLQFPVQKSEAEWKALLTPEQYRITRLKGTERAFTGEYWNTKITGTYECVACGRKLFLSDAKFESGCGWPSFFKAVDETAIVTQEDRSILPARVEIMCSNCGSHLGHVFEDGPPPTGLRFCVNSAAVRLVPREPAGSASH